MPMKTTNFKVAKVSNRGVLSRTGTSTAVTIFRRQGRVGSAPVLHAHSDPNVPSNSIAKRKKRHD